MVKKKKLTSLFKRNKQEGKIEKGAIYVVVFMTSLIFLGYMFVGGTIPITVPGNSTELVSLIFEDPKEPQDTLQLYTFTGATLTPPPNNDSAEPQDTTIQYSITKRAECPALSGGDQSQIIRTYRSATTQASDNQPSLQLFYGGATAMRAGVREMIQFPNDVIVRPQLGQLSPALYITDITDDATATTGDFQNGGTPQGASKVLGSWQPEGGPQHTQSNGFNLTPVGDTWPAANGPEGDSRADLTWTAEVVWKYGDLTANGQPLQPGRTYRIQMVVHDGETPAGTGQMCIETTIPGGTAATNSGGTNTGGTGGTGNTNTGNSTGTGTQPNGPSGTWRLVFSDEFTGNALNLSKWQMCNPSFASSCNPYNNEQQKFNVSPTNNSNVVVSGGQLHLIATRTNGQIMSGMVSTGPNKFGYNLPGYQPFLYTYGYYEGRVKMPKGQGFWPSLWELPDQDVNGGWPGSGEMDVVEIKGANPSQLYFTAHWAGGGGCGNHACSPQQITVADTSAAFHTFGLDWQPTGLTWYFDGEKIGNTVTDPGAIKNHPFYIMANFSVGGDFDGNVDASTPFPASMDIDYLRVWQKN
ncbi:MAG: glycoside hydrolase family 16 protein [Patescibacteria group bacterium]